MLWYLTQRTGRDLYFKFFAPPQSSAEALLSEGNNLIRQLKNQAESHFYRARSDYVALAASLKEHRMGVVDLVFPTNLKNFPMSCAPALWPTQIGNDVDEYVGVNLEKAYALYSVAKTMEDNNFDPSAINSAINAIQIDYPHAEDALLVSTTSLVLGDVKAYVIKLEKSGIKDLPSAAKKARQDRDGEARDRMSDSFIEPENQDGEMLKPMGKSKSG